ncbi:MAG: hypothetical protein COB20_10865 [SAR86 cluster bacterium]|uniref:Uncharacterized protein n=1 Tax=SAR86 cluster bacterium TaxID=2030880 RepID=A0A2A4X221_9GAMM|nr:MAG: hypothetical protein COB20_10865 [SAR86 cluster bacterium]
MITQQDRKTNTRLFTAPIILCLLALSSSSAIAASATSADSTSSWSLVITLLVLAATAGSAVLNVAAIRHWDRNWGLVSGLPLLGLLLWGALIVVSKQFDASAHELWALEIFAWAMINLIYMVTAMTAKRMFAKRDGEESASS